MIKRIFAIVLVLGLMTIGSQAMAEDGNNVWDITADALSGRQDSCPTSLALGLIGEKQVKGIPLLNMVPILNLSRMQAGVRGYTPMGEKFAKEGEIVIGADFIWNFD